MAVVIVKSKVQILSGRHKADCEIGAGFSVGLKPTSVLSISVRDGVVDSEQI